MQALILNTCHFFYSRTPLFAALSSLLLMTSCAPYRFETISFLEEDPLYEQQIYVNKKQALQQPLYNFIPRHRAQIYWYDIGHWMPWMLFGNDDDGIFGEERSAHFQLDKPNNGMKALAWGVRNPLHNFCFYVIGSAYTCNSEFTILNISSKHMSLLTYSPVATTVFADKRSSFYLGLHGWKPFISLRLTYGPCYKSEFYIGWRCRGNFGLKCILLTKRKQKELERDCLDVLD